MTANDLRVGLAVMGDADALAQLHESVLPQSRLSLFGHRYIASCYSYFLHSPNELVFVARIGDVVVGGGFVSFVPDTLWRRLLVRTSLIGQLALRPFGRGARQIATDFISLPAAPPSAGGPELVAIFVAPECRGQGIGETICRSVEAELARRNVRFYQVRTERDPRNRAIVFYRRLGFTESVGSGEERFLVLSKSLP